MKLKYLLFLIAAVIIAPELSAQDYQARATEVLREQILNEAEWALKQQPVTVTASSSPRSAGTRNDFFSEADYFWPDTLNPDGPYVNRDGMTNPGIFTDHRFAMIRFSRIIGSLSSAYILTGKDKYVKHAMVHLKAWFVNADTRMNPSMTFAQAIKGRNTGRGIGIIDTIHLMEVAQGVKRMADAKSADASVVEGTKKWFADYLTWLTSHQYGKDEMNTKNNHSTCG